MALANECEFTKGAWHNTTKLYHKSFWTMLVGKHWKNCGTRKIGHFESFWITLVTKDMKKCRMTKITNANMFTTEHAQ